jgi:hypothetical protein
MGAKRCISFLSFAWKFKNINYLNFPMSYGRYTKKSVFAFFAPPKSLFVRNLITATKKEKKREKKSEREREKERERDKERDFPIISIQICASGDK